MLLVLVMVCSVLPLTSFAEETVSITSHGIKNISDRGNVALNLTHEEVFAHFDYGDIVTVTMGSLSVDLPIVNNYACVAAGSPAIYMYQKGTKQEVRLVCNMKQYASEYKIAYQPDAENAPEEWAYNDGFSADMDVTITMKEKAGYLEEFTILSLSYSKNREDFPNLTDEEFANFRMVQMGDIAPGVLYRSATPIAADYNRNTYSDEAARQAGITVFVNLVDDEKSEVQAEGYEGSYYSQQKRIAAGVTFDFTKPENRQKLAQAFAFMAENPGVYDIFCKEGKDRTGFVLMLLEALMGASAEEMEQDYMCSFQNYYGVTHDSDAYPIIVKGNYIKIAQDNIGASPMDENFQQIVEDYFLGLGLSPEQIIHLKTNLAGGKAPVVQETEAAEEPTETETTVETTADTTAETVPESTAPAVQKTSEMSTAGVVIALVLLAGLSWLAWRRRK